MTEAAADRIGQVIDNRYRIVELIGEGGMGAVFAAEHLKLRKQVALKIIRAEFASNTIAEARFAREATATSRLDHPHVASAIDTGTLPDGGLYLVTQLVRGQSLARRLEAGRMRWSEAAELGAQVADALAAAHAAGIVHRDLKPDNILVETRADGKIHVKVVDFGIARLSEEAVDGTLKPLTRMGAIIGTPGYMAPEQAVGEAVDARGDLYALGVILWECCAGRRLWTGDDLTDMIATQLSTTPSTLSQVCGGAVSPAFSEVVARLLAAAPSQRPQSAATVHAALRGLALGVPTVVEAGLGPLAATSTAALPQAIVPARQRRWTTIAGKALDRRRWLAVAAVAAVSLAVVLVLLLSGDSDEFVVDGEDDEVAVAGIAGETPAAPVVAAPDDAPPVDDAPLDADPPADETKAAAIPPIPADDTKAGAPLEPPGAGDDAKAGADADAELPADEGEDEEEELEPETEPAPPVVAPAGARPVPAALAGSVSTLAGGSRKARKRAAAKVIGWKPKAEVPLFALNIAWLEKAGSCGNKRAVIDKIEADGDPRALPALRRLSRVRRSGCGWFNAQDCLGCLRGTLSHAIAFLEGRAAAQKP